MHVRGKQNQVREIQTPLEEIRDWKDTKQVLIPSLGKVIRFERDEGDSAPVSKTFLWHSSLILMSHHATLARFNTHLKQLSRWEGTLCSCALGGRHSQHLPVVWSSVVLAPQCNFQNVLGCVLGYHRSSAAVDSLKCRQVVVYNFQLSVSLVSLVSAMEKVSKHQKEERSERWEGGFAFSSMFLKLLSNKDTSKLLSNKNTSAVHGRLSSSISGQQNFYVTQAAADFTWVQWHLQKLVSVRFLSDVKFISVMKMSAQLFHQWSQQKGKCQEMGGKQETKQGISLCYCTDPWCLYNLCMVHRPDPHSPKKG